MKQQGIHKKEGQEIVCFTYLYALYDPPFISPKRYCSETVCKSKYAAQKKQEKQKRAGKACHQRLPFPETSKGNDASM